MKTECTIFSTRNFDLNRFGFWGQNRNKDKFRDPDLSLLEALHPMFFMFRIFGLAPYRFLKHRLVASDSHLFFSFFALFMNTYVAVISFLHILEDHSKKSLLTATERGKFIFNYTTLMIEVVIDMSKRKQFLEIWNIIQDFDYETRQLGFPLSNKKTKFWVWIVVIIHSLYWLFINQTGMYAFSESFLKNIGYMFLYIGNCISLIKFCGMATLLGLRFKHLNKIFGEWSPDKSRRASEPKFNTKITEKLQDDLMLAGEKLNSLYCWSLLLWLFNLCIHAVSGTFLFFQFMIHHSDHMGISVCTCLIAWLLSYNIQLVILSSACHFASTEANRMGYNMLNFRRWQSQDFESTIHLMNYKLNFSAAGCCYVNLPLLRSIAGLLTTYLVILLQIPN